MRLIDANMLEDDGANYVWERSLTYDFVKTEYRFVNRLQIDEAPTVDAVPIEWLEKKRMWSAACNDIFCANYIEYLIKEWKKENESDKTG